MSIIFYVIIPMRKKIQVIERSSATKFVSHIKSQDETIGSINYLVVGKVNPCLSSHVTFT